MQDDLCEIWLTMTGLIEFQARVVGRSYQTDCIRLFLSTNPF